MFKALVVNKDDSGYSTKLQELEDNSLPAGDVTVKVQYSTLNYKDALAITGKGAVVRKFPMVPGIDFAGIVEQSDNPSYVPGDLVLLNGWGVGETHWGGLAARARVNGNWLIPIPAGITAEQAMAIGTAGYTAMLCIIALERNRVIPRSGPILVTGANGGVGSFAIALLNRLGYQVVASTGRPQESAYLKSLGASEIIDRAELSSPGKPLAKERWAGVVDSVGSHTLVNACASTQYGGVVAACGLAQGMDFPATVAPFILRGVTLVGIDSVMRPRVQRIKAWSRLAQLVDPQQLRKITRKVSLAEVGQLSNELLAGEVRGRIVVEL
jgi:acrylyl-CoA reductase (NADPH)